MDDIIVFEYKIIETITNKYFLDYQREKGLFSATNLCTEIDLAIQGKKYVDCCTKLRLANENLIIFLHEFFVRGNRNFLGLGWTAASDRMNELKHHFGEDKTALVMLGNLSTLQIRLNAYHHPENCTATIAETDAEQCIPVFSEVLITFAEFLEQRVPNEYAKNDDKEKITGEVSLNWIRKDCCITATVTGSNCQKDFFYTWLVGDKQSRVKEKDEIFKGPNKNTLELNIKGRENYVGKYVTCLVSCAVPDLYSGCIKNKNCFRLTKEMFEPVRKTSNNESINLRTHKNGFKDNGHGQISSEKIETLVGQGDKKRVLSDNAENGNAVARREASIETSLQKKIKNFFLSFSKKETQAEEKEVLVVEENTKINEKTATEIEDDANALYCLGRKYVFGSRRIEKDYEKAKELFQKAADFGDLNAMFSLGVLYEEGKGVDQDYQKAAEWYQNAADLGNTNAMINIGLLYKDGYGVDQDYQKAAEWFQKAVNLGNVDAMFNIGVLYEDGKGVNQDYQKAAEWYQKAADLGITAAMDNLGLLYEHGKGVNQDYQKAAEWYQKAADLGFANAMNNIGLLYKDGYGVDQDYQKAAEWFQKAVNLGNVSAMNNLGILYKNGKGVNQDYQKAAEWYQKATDLGCANAKYNLEILYKVGDEVEPDYQKVADLRDGKEKPILKVYDTKSDEHDKRRLSFVDILNEERASKRAVKGIEDKDTSTDSEKVLSNYDIDGDSKEKEAQSILNENTEEIEELKARLAKLNVKE